MYIKSFEYDFWVQYFPAQTISCFIAEYFQAFAVIFYKISKTQAYISLSELKPGFFQIFCIFLKNPPA